MSLLKTLVWLGSGFGFGLRFGLGVRVEGLGLGLKIFWTGTSVFEYLAPEQAWKKISQPGHLVHVMEWVTA